MWEDIELFVYKYGSYWLIAVCAVGVSKLYSREEQTLRSVIRSVVAALLFVYAMVDFGLASGADAAMFSVYVLIGSFLIDAQVELLMVFKKKLLDDPEAIIKMLFRGKDK